jgi:hypothetical protein
MPRSSGPSSSTRTASTHPCRPARSTPTSQVGWATAGEPSGDAFVWLEHETTGGKARFPLAVLPQWQVLGWQPGAPPKPVDTLRDPQLVASDAVDASQDDAKPTKTAIAAKKEQ